jgi:hypothetical protein
MYVHELAEWPGFHWNKVRLAEPLAQVRHRQGLLIGHMGLWVSISGRKLFSRP